MSKMINTIILPYQRKLTKIKQGERNYLLCRIGMVAHPY